MMKYTGSVSLGLGLFFAVPALTFGGGLPDSVQTALSETIRAIEVLGQLDTRIDSGQSLPPNAAVQVTEAASGTERSRDERRSQLRDEVAQLQAQVDAKKLTGAIPMASNETVATSMTRTSDSTSADPSNEGINTHNVSPGLSPTFIRALGSAQFGKQATGQQPNSPSSSASTKVGSSSVPNMADSRPEARQATTAAPTQKSTSTPTEPASASPEGKGYSAHPLRQAQACYRAGRYEQGIELLAAVDPNPVVNYWKARLYEQVGRTAEAIRLYEQVELNETAGDLHDSAKREREFAQWRRDFENKSGITAKPKAAKK